MDNYCNYVGILTICVGRFALANKTKDDPYDSLDYIAMILMSPFFIVHRSFTWLYNNWHLIFTDYLPRFFTWSIATLEKFINFFVIRPVQFILGVLNRILCWGIRQIEQFIIWVKPRILSFFNWVCDVIVIVFQFIQTVYQFVYDIFYYMCVWPMQKLVKFFNHLIDRLVNYVIFELVVPFAKYCWNDLALPFAKYCWNDLALPFAKYCWNDLIVPLVQKCVEWINWFYDLLPWLLEKTIEYLFYIWNGIYGYILYPLYEYLIYYPFHFFYIFFWKTFITFIGVAWVEICNLYFFLWNLASNVWVSVVNFANTLWNSY